MQLLGEVGRKVQLALKGPAVWQARAGTRVCEAQLECMGAVHTRTANVLEVRWRRHQREEILDMYDEVVGTAQQRPMRRHFGFTGSIMSKGGAIMRRIMLTEMLTEIMCQNGYGLGIHVCMHVYRSIYIYICVCLHD